MKMFEVILFILEAILLAVVIFARWRRKAVSYGFHRQVILTKEDLIETPTVTVCIPARNEGHALTDCLQRVVDSSYSKLEIIVLDDLSADKTPALIKSFASEGVRFVEGSALPKGWLGKNHALQELLDEASGEYVFFIDADTRLEPDSIEQLVAEVQDYSVQMISVLPRRNDGWRGSVLFSPLRYFWEVMFHQTISPATASNAWIIHRKTFIDTLQGFNQFKSDIQPESKIAAQLAKTGQYRFVFGDPQMGISYEKKWLSQAETSIRLLFPLLGNNVSHGIIALLDLLIMTGPLWIIIGGFFFGFGLHQIIAGVLWLLFAYVYGKYLKWIWDRGWWLGGLLWPFIVLQEAILLIISMIKYSKQSVTWKGRIVKV